MKLLVEVEYTAAGTPTNPISKHKGRKIRSIHVISTSDILMIEKIPFDFEVSFPDQE